MYRRDIEELILIAEEAEENYDLRRAADFYEKAWKKAKRDGNFARDEKILNVLLRLSRIYQILGNFRKALRSLRKALSLSKETDDLKSQADILRKIGDVLGRCSKWDESLKYYRESLEIYEKIGDLRGIAHVNNGMGMVLFERGKMEEALENYHKALRIARQINLSSLLAYTANNLGACYNVMGEWEVALTYYRKSLEEHKKLENLQGIAQVQHNIGITLLDQRKYKEAREYLLKSFRLSKRIKEANLEALSSLNLANLCIRTNRLRKAELYLNTAYQIFSKQKDLLGIAEFYKLMGIVERRKGKLEKAEELLEKSLKIYEKSDNPLGLAETYRELGILYEERGKREKTWKWLESSFKVFKGLKAKKESQSVREELLRLEYLYLSTLRDLGASVDRKDPYTLGHSERVASLAFQLALFLDLEKEYIKGILAAAFLHDIGKLRIPDKILKKPAKLTEEEYEVMKNHPLFALEELHSLEFPWEVKPFIRHHHERYDGKGYPDGLKNEQIPLGARIIAVVDTFDALTTERPYRPPYSEGEAVNIMRGVKGTQLDPDLVDAFVSLLEGYEFKEEGIEKLWEKSFFWELD